MYVGIMNIISQPGDNHSSAQGPFVAVLWAETTIRSHTSIGADPPPTPPGKPLQAHVCVHSRTLAKGGQCYRGTRRSLPGPSPPPRQGDRHPPQPHAAPQRPRERSGSAASPPAPGGRSTRAPSPPQRRPRRQPRAPTRPAPRSRARASLPAPSPPAQGAGPSAPRGPATRSPPAGGGRLRGERGRRGRAGG